MIIKFDKHFNNKLKCLSLFISLLRKFKIFFKPIDNEHIKIKDEMYVRYYINKDF